MQYGLPFYIHTYLLTYCEGGFVEVATVNVDTNVHTYIRIYIAPKIVRTNLRFLTQPTCRAPALRIARRTRWRLPARGRVDHAEERALRSAGDSRDAGPTALRLSRVCTLQQPRSISQRASFSSPDARRKQLPHLLLPPPPPPPLLLLLLLLRVLARRRGRARRTGHVTDCGLPWRHTRRQPAPS